jgi:hypothetical protein
VKCGPGEQCDSCIANAWCARESPSFHGKCTTDGHCAQTFSFADKKEDSDSISGKVLLNGFALTGEMVLGARTQKLLHNDYYNLIHSDQNQKKLKKFGQVVCREVGKQKSKFHRFTTFPTSTHAEYPNQESLTSIQCNGTESRLQDCSMIFNAAEHGRWRKWNYIPKERTLIVGCSSHENFVLDAQCHNGKFSRPENRGVYGTGDKFQIAVPKNVKWGIESHSAFELVRFESRWVEGAHLRLYTAKVKCVTERTTVFFCIDGRSLVLGSESAKECLTVTCCMFTQVVSRLQKRVATTPYHIGLEFSMKATISKSFAIRHFCRM